MDLSYDMYISFLQGCQGGFLHSVGGERHFIHTGGECLSGLKGNPRRMVPGFLR